MGDWNTTSGDQKMGMSRFDLFKDQQERFKDALLDYDPHIWFPPLRGDFEEDDPRNWFVAFVPPSWGRWKGAVYCVHFDFKYGRPPRFSPEQIRLVVGVETVRRASECQAFKEDVIARAKARRITTPGFFLQARHRKKLLETNPTDPILFNEQSWKASLQRYIALQPLVEVIATVAREYYERGAFTCQWISPPGA